MINISKSTAQEHSSADGVSNFPCGKPNRLERGSAIIHYSCGQFRDGFLEMGCKPISSHRPIQTPLRTFIKECIVLHYIFYITQHTCRPEKLITTIGCHTVRELLFLLLYSTAITAQGKLFVVMYCKLLFHRQVVI